MIKVSQCGQYIMGDHEVLDNIAQFISFNVGQQDWMEHIENIKGYLAAGIQWHPDEVVGYLKTKLR